MKGKVLLLSAGIFLASIFTSSLTKAQQDEPIVIDKVMKVNPRRPPQPSKYYSGTKIKKDKKFKIKLRMIQGWECPSYLHYESKPQKKREKMLRKQRKKLIASN